MLKPRTPLLCQCPTGTDTVCGHMPAVHTDSGICRVTGCRCTGWQHALALAPMPQPESSSQDAEEGPSWDDYVAASRKFIAHYPADIFNGTNPGSIFVQGIRHAINVLDGAYAIPEPEKMEDAGGLLDQDLMVDIGGEA